MRLGWLAVCLAACTDPAPPAPSPAIQQSADPKPRAPAEEKRAATRALFESYPALEKRLPWRVLGELPTAVESAAALGQAIGIERLYLKRDDRAGNVYGGGKLRKLEPFLGDAARKRSKTLITTGGVASNQALATALYGKQQGFSVTLLLLSQAPSAEAREHLLAEHALGARLELLGAVGDENAALERRARRDPESYVIPAGGTTPLGDTGFVNAGFELAAQVKAGVLPEPDFVYLPLGTGGSAAGLAVGLSVAGLRTRVVAVRVATERYGTHAKLMSEAKRVSDYLHGLDATFPDRALEPDRIRVENGFVGRGYAVPSAEGGRAQKLAEKHGIVLDATYSAKTLAALMANAEGIRKNVVVFWLTYDARRVPSAGVDYRELPRSFHVFFRERG
jgi:D-cysteine desulfhydrase